MEAVRNIPTPELNVTPPLSVPPRRSRAQALFSPELVRVKNETYKDFILGNINRDWLIDLPAKPVLVKMFAEIEAGVTMCRDRCPYFDVCGGGEPANKLAENGTFASSETSSCRLTRMTVADVVLNGIGAL